MEIESIKFIHLENAGDLKAVFSFKMGSFILKGFQIVMGPYGLFVCPPSEKNKKGVYKDLFYPDGQTANKRFQDWILSEYRKESNGRKQPA